MLKKTRHLLIICKMTDKNCKKHTSLIKYNARAEYKCARGTHKNVQKNLKIRQNLQNSRNFCVSLHTKHIFISQKQY